MPMRNLSPIESYRGPTELSYTFGLIFMPEKETRFCPDRKSGEPVTHPTTPVKTTPKPLTVARTLPLVLRAVGGIVEERGQAALRPAGGRSLRKTYPRCGEWAAPMVRIRFI